MSITNPLRTLPHIRVVSGDDLSTAKQCEYLGRNSCTNQCPPSTDIPHEGLPKGPTLVVNILVKTRAGRHSLPSTRYVATGEEAVRVKVEV